jgi:AcrR family transcriptional regulator
MSAPDASESLAQVTVLYEASRLFASQGYDATTVADVASQAGMDESQVVEFFPTTEAMMQALLDHDLEKALESAELEAISDDRAVVRLFRYLASDIAWVVSSPYDLTGIDRVHLIKRPEFAPWRDKMDRLRALRLSMIRQAIEDGDFIRVAPGFAQESITSMIMGTIEARRGEPVDDPMQHGTELASLAMRSLLKDPLRLNEIRREAGLGGA